jgi:L-seryl-tRNA(Ser) seleniumtransferase
VAIAWPRPDELAQRLRRGAPPGVGRIAEGRMLLDIRTVLAEQEPELIDMVRAALQG